MKLNYRKTILIGFAFMSISCFWQMYDNIVPLILKHSFHMGEIITGGIMAVDNVLALVLLPIFGALSDRVHTKIGKRMPFILAGTFLSVVAMYFMPIADNSRNLVLFLVMTGVVLLSMGLFRSPAVALMPDVTPRPLRSKGNAIINLMGTVGAIYALIMIGRVVDEGLTPNYKPLFLSIILFMVVSTIVLFITVHENKWVRLAREAEMKEFSKEEKKGLSNKELIKEEETGISKEETDKNVSHKMHLPKPEKRSLVCLLLSVCFWYMAYNAVTTAFSRYATEVWNLQSGGYADCLMISTVAAIISYIPLGFIAGKIGRKKSVILGVIGLTVGFLYVGLFMQYNFWINIGFVLIGIAWAAINVNSFPMVVEIASDGDVGRYTGYYYVFSMLAQILTPVLSGILLQMVSYKTLFPYAVVFSALAFVTMWQVKHGDVKPIAKKSVLENFDIDD